MSLAFALPTVMVIGLIALIVYLIVSRNRSDR